MLERQREAAHDRKTKTKAAIFLGIGVSALKHFENRVALGGGYARASVADLDTQGAAAQSAAEQHAPTPRVSQCVCQQVLKDAPHHQRIGANEGR